MDGGSYHSTGSGDGNRPQDKEMQEGKWLSEEALQIPEKKKGSKRQRSKGKIYPSECRVPKNSREIRKPSLVIKAKK